MEEPKIIIDSFKKCIVDQQPCHGCYQGGPGFGIECRKSLCRDALILLYDAYNTKETNKKGD